MIIGTARRTSIINNIKAVIKTVFSPFYRTATAQPFRDSRFLQFSMQILTSVKNKRIILYWKKYSYELSAG